MDPLPYFKLALSELEQLLCNAPFKWRAESVNLIK